MFLNRPRGPEKMAHLSDESLCREVARGNQEAFLALFDRYWAQVFRFAYSVIRNQAEAEDVAQSLFLEVHTTLLRYDEQKGQFRSLLFRYAYSRAVDRRRRLQSRGFYSNVPFEEIDPKVLERHSSLIGGLSAEDATRLVEQAMEHLDDKQRLTIQAYFFRGLSLHEIAGELGESFGNTRHYLYRGLERMRKLLVPREESGELEETEQRVEVRPPRRAAKRFASEVSGV